MAGLEDDVGTVFRHMPRTGSEAGDHLTTWEFLALGPWGIGGCCLFSAEVTGGWGMESKGSDPLLRCGYSEGPPHPHRAPGVQSCSI